jgi:hypothetical protein
MYLKKPWIYWMVSGGWCADARDMWALEHFKLLAAPPEQKLDAINIRSFHRLIGIKLSLDERCKRGLGFLENGSLAKRHSHKPGA